MVVNRVGALSAAKIAGMVYGILGLMFGALFSLLAMAGALASASDAGGVMGAILGVGAIIVMPILYGGFGFVMTLLMVSLFNLSARTVGGVQIDVT